MADAYTLPDAPGVWMNFDNTVSIRYDVRPDEDFERAALGIFGLVREAEGRYPGWPRLLFLRIDGHIDDLGRFEPDMVELQQEFLFSVAGPFVTAVEAPLVNALNPEPQRDDLPDRLAFGPPA